MAENIDLSTTSNSENYLTRNYIMEYLNDSVQQLLETKNSNPKIDVLEFFTEYFKSVKLGNHIVFREYSFIAATPYNRACFIQKFLDTYNYMISRDDPINIHEYQSLILLLCYDFPVDIVTNSLKAISSEDNLTGLFKDFLYSFQFQFYYKEFCKDVKDIYDNLEKIYKKSSDNKVNKDLFLKNFIESIEILGNQVNYSFPDKKFIRDLVSSKQKVFDFYEFINDLSKSEKIISGIGKLPLNQTLLTEHQSKISSQLSSLQSKETKTSDTQKTKSNEKAEHEHSDSCKSSSEEGSSDTDT